MTATGAGGGLDRRAARRFAGRLFGILTGGALSLMIDLAQRTGLFDALATGPATSAEVARRAGLQERYVRECLGALVSGALVDYDPVRGVYTLPAEHATCLASGGLFDMTPFARMNTLLGTHMEDVATAFRDGGGVPYEQFGAEFVGVMDTMNRGLLDNQLLAGILPSTGVVAQLAAGVRVADVGCGTGHAVVLMAREYPRSTFVGYDLGADAIDAARAEATAAGLSNATFEVLDVATLPVAPPFDVVFAFDAIHDQVDPAGVLRRVYDALLPGGTFAMMDIKATSRLEGNVGSPFAPWVYAVSTMHCMTVSLAHGGAGLGAAWGEELALRMLADAGFGGVTVHDVPDSSLNSLYVARKPSGRG